MKPYYENGCVTLYRADALDFLENHTGDLVVLDPPLHPGTESWMRGVVEKSLVQGNTVALAARAYAVVGLSDDRLHFVDDVYDETRRAGFHNNARPRTWVTNMLTRFSPKSVLDPFCGSGVVLLECRKAGIPCCGGDISDVYVRGVRELLVEAYIEEDTTCST